MPSPGQFKDSSSTLKIGGKSASWNCAAAAKSKSGKNNEDDVISIDSSSSFGEFVAKDGNSLVLKDHRSPSLQKKYQPKGDDDDASAYSLASSSDEDEDYVPARGSRENTTKNNNALVRKRTASLGASISTNQGGAPQKKQRVSRIEKRMEKRTKAASGYDNNKEERKALHSSISVAHEVLNSQTGRMSTRVSMVGPVVPASCVGLKGATNKSNGPLWNSGNPQQNRNERKNSHKRSLDPKAATHADAAIGGWVAEANKAIDGADYEVIGTSPEDIAQGKMKAVKCLTCGVLLPDSIGLSRSFKEGVRAGVKHSNGHNGYDPLRRHLKRCGEGKRCSRCGTTLEEYESLNGNDSGWGQHETQCKKWHENFAALKQLQKKYNTWNISPKDKSLTKAEKKTADWKQNQRKSTSKAKHTDNQKKMFAENFPGWY